MEKIQKESQEKNLISSEKMFSILNQKSPEYIKYFFPSNQVDLNEQGYPVCKKCHEPRYCVFNADGVDRVFPTACKCMKESF